MDLIQFMQTQTVIIGKQWILLLPVTKLMLETIGGRVEDFAIEPNEKLTIEADDRALFLVSKEKRIPIAPLGDYGRYFMQKDKIDRPMN